MKTINPFIQILICFLTSQILLGQEYKADKRPKMVKENSPRMYYPESFSMLDIIKALDKLGIGLYDFQLKNLEKNYDLILVANKFEKGRIIETDTLARFDSAYRYYEADKPYFDYLDNIKITTNTIDNKAEVYVDSYSYGSKSIIELNRTNKNSKFYWRRYKNTDWKLDQKVPLLIFASTWKDEKFGFERFCGVVELTENEKDTDELLSLSPVYSIFYLLVKEK